MSTSTPAETRTLERPPGDARVLRFGSGRYSVRLHVRTVVVCAALAVVALAVAVISIGSGHYPLTPVEVLQTLLGGGPDGADFIVYDLRVPRVLDAFLVGGALGVAGAIFQSLTRNPLGSPDVIGFTQGAAAGALITFGVVGGGTFAVALGAVVGGIVTAVLVYSLAFQHGSQGYRLVLVGIGFSSLLASFTAFMITKVDPGTAQAARVWLVGNLEGRGWEHVAPVALALAVLLPCTAFLASRLRLLEMGDDAASALGIRVERSRLALVAVGVLLTAVAVASAGPIAFVALAAPQLARRLTRATGPGMAGAAVMGATLLAASDLAAERVFPDTPLPVGIVTGGVGGVYLAWLLFTEWKTPRGVRSG